MKRVVILGRGAAGKSTLARQLGGVTGLPVIELDTLFWQSGLAPTERAQWIELQNQLVRSNEWILDGDLGPHDAVEARLSATDTIILLDFGCASRDAGQRSSSDAPLLFRMLAPGLLREFTRETVGSRTEADRS